MKSPALRRGLHVATGAVVFLAVISPDALRYGVGLLALLSLPAEWLRLRVGAVAGWIARSVPVFREREGERPSGAFWLTWGYALAVWVPMPAPVVGIACAALADPAASFIGSRWGCGAKSWQGTGAAAVAGAAAATACFAAGVDIGWWTPPVAGAVTAVLERWPGPFDDNLVVAPGVALAIWGLA